MIRIIGVMFAPLVLSLIGVAAILLGHRTTGIALLVASIFLRALYIPTRPLASAFHH